MFSRVSKLARPVARYAERSIDPDSRERKGKEKGKAPKKKLSIATLCASSPTLHHPTHTHPTKH